MVSMASFTSASSAWNSPSGRALRLPCATVPANFLIRSSGLIMPLRSSILATPDDVWAAIRTFFQHEADDAREGA